MNDEYLLQMRGISKSYGGVEVLHSVNFDLKAGEVHAFVGENGAGKSTLIKILGGAVIPEKGTIKFDGKEINLRTYNPAVAHEYGISTVHQELMQANDISVGENIFMGRYPLKYGKVDWKKLNADAQSFLNPIDENIKSSAILGNLSMAYRQMVEIAKATSYNAKIIIFDEPTSSLTEEETGRLFEIIRKLKANGTAIIYISHRLEEIFEISDRVTVLRDGTMIGTKDIAEVTTDSLISMMVGRDLSNLYPKEVAEIGDVVLKIENLNSSIVKDINLEVRAGEILGIGGLVGAGRTELMLSLAGSIPYTGKVFVEGKEVSIKTPKDSFANGIAYLTEDRKSLGLLLGFEIYKNITLSSLTSHSHGPVLDHKKERDTAREMQKKMKIVARSLNLLTGNLSGGNQQKVLLGRMLVTNPKVLILDEPTRGVDVGAKAEIYGIMSDLAKNGTAIIMISSEMPELIAMSDRIVVMNEGHITGELQKDEINEVNIMKYATRSVQ